MPQSTGGGKGPAWEGYHGRERNIFLSTGLLILFIRSLAKGYAHYKSHRRCKKPIELSNFVSGVRDTVSKKANCMYSNLTHYNENLEAKNSEWPKEESIFNSLKESRHNSHREITITVATHVDFIWNRNNRSRKLSSNFFVLIVTL